MRCWKLAKKMQNCFLFSAKVYYELLVHARAFTIHDLRFVVSFSMFISLGYSFVYPSRHCFQYVLSFLSVLRMFVFEQFSCLLSAVWSRSKQGAGIILTRSIFDRQIDFTNITELFVMQNINNYLLWGSSSTRISCIFLSNVRQLFICSAFFFIKLLFLCICLPFYSDFAVLE